MEKTLNAAEAKRSLESYLENVLQTFIDTTGIYIEEIKISSITNPATNKRSIKKVRALEDTQVITAAWS